MGVMTSPRDYHAEVAGVMSIDSAPDSVHSEIRRAKETGEFHIQVDALPRRSSVAPPAAYCPEVDWKMDPVLELWVDVEHTPAIIRLRGTIDGTTGTNVRGVVEELLTQGYSSITMEVDELELPVVAGYSALIAIDELVRQAGGRLHWSSWPTDKGES